jgi:glycosyltransferase involved in cell wall biosynthesis
VWIVAQDWRTAIDFLGVRQSSVRTFVSVVSHQDKRLTPWETWFRAWSKPLPAHVTLIAHSPVSFRFLKELVGVPENQLELLPLPLPVKHFEQKQGDFIVGTYGSFNSQANLHFVLTVAHYVTKKNPNINFRIVGSGPLRGHLNQLCQDLDLGSQVTIIESMDLHYPNSFSVSLDFSHHNDHFISQLLAGMAGAVPICLETEGLAEYIKDSSNGFITSQDDTKNVGELILSLKNNPLLFQEMSRRHRQQMESQYSSQEVAQGYLETFFEGAYQTMNFVRCAR